jgi:hypothetical protein
MLVMRTTKDPTDPIRKLISSQKTLRFHDLALAVYPLWLDGVEPRTLLRQRRQLTILTPSPLSLTSRLCFPSQRLTSLEMCQEALSQMRIMAFLPAASSF